MYATLTTPNCLMRLLDFPTTLSQAKRLVQEHGGHMLLDGRYIVTEWREASCFQPDGELVESDIDQAQWRFQAKSGRLQLRAFLTTEPAKSSLRTQDLILATQQFLESVRGTGVKELLLESAEDTHTTVFDARANGEIALVCAPRRTFEHLRRIASDAGYTSRM